MSRIPVLIERLAASLARQELLLDRPKAAVAVILAPNPDSILLIRRAEREGDHWSGQMAFPGGRWNPGDADLADTARRETLEEVGLDLARAPVRATLDDLVPSTLVLPPIVVRPFVFAVPEPAPLHSNSEVAGAWWVPFDTLLESDLLRPMEYERKGMLVRSSGYHLKHGVLWGMTERILTPLLDLIRESGNPGIRQ